MSFTLDLQKAVSKMKADTDVVVGKVLLDLGASLVQKSPVGDGKLWKSRPPAGYVGGRFRANWQYGFGQVPRGDLADIDPSGGVSLKRIESGMSENKKAGIHYLTNNLPYAQALEDGHSTQAPSGVVELTLIEFPGIVRRAEAG